MHRIDTQNFAKTEDGKNLFRDANPHLEPPLRATSLDAAWFNGIQESLANIVESQGMELQKGDYTTLLKAIDAQMEKVGDKTADILLKYFDDLLTRAHHQKSFNPSIKLGTQAGVRLTINGGVWVRNYNKIDAFVNYTHEFTGSNNEYHFDTEIALRGLPKVATFGSCRVLIDGTDIFTLNMPPFSSFNSFRIIPVNHNGDDENEILVRCHYKAYAVDSRKPDVCVHITYLTNELAK